MAMELLLLMNVHSLVSLILTMIFIKTSDTGMIQVVHPDLEFYYLQMMRSTAVSEDEDHFSAISKEQKRQICLSSVQSSSFYVSDDKRSNLTLTRFSVRTAVEDINGWYDTNIPDAVKYYSVATAVEGVVLRINAYRCQSTPEMKWFLTQGHLPGTYITLSKDHRDFYTIRGLLEATPEITSINGPENKFALDKWFARKIEKIHSFETAKRKNRGICQLTDFQKVRLCSAVYVVHQQHVGGKVKTTNIVDGNRNVCFKNARIKLETDEDTIEEVSMDLIPCTFSERSSAPIFYLADDIHSENSVFVLHRTDDDASQYSGKRQLPEKAVDPDSSAIITFRLMLHVQKLTQLG